MSLPNHIVGMERVTYGRIIKTFHEEFIEELYEKGVIDFPNKMGKLVLKVIDTSPRFNATGKIIKTKIDWGSTMKLWRENETYREKKTLVRYPARKELTIMTYMKCRGFHKPIKFKIGRGLYSRFIKYREENNLKIGYYGK